MAETQEDWEKTTISELLRAIPDLLAEDASELLRDYGTPSEYTPDTRKSIIAAIREQELGKVWNPRGLATVTFEVSGLWYDGNAPSSDEFRTQIARGIIQGLVSAEKYPNITYDVSSVTASITGSVPQLSEIDSSSEAEFTRIVKDKILDSFGVPDGERNLWGIEVFMMEGNDFATAVVRKYRESAHDSIDPDSANYYVSNVKTQDYEVVSTIIRKTEEEGSNA